jgi:hypothetical protein
MVPPEDEGSGGSNMQITQFVIDLCIVYYATFQLYAHRTPF